jgi:hypothetical protein
LRLGYLLWYLSKQLFSILYEITFWFRKSYILQCVKKSHDPILVKKHFPIILICHLQSRNTVSSRLYLRLWQLLYIILSKLWMQLIQQLWTINMFLPWVIFMFSICRFILKQTSNESFISPEYDGGLFVYSRHGLGLREA